VHQASLIAFSFCLNFYLKAWTPEASIAICYLTCVLASVVMTIYSTAYMPIHFGCLKIGNGFCSG
jgi:hypothetical protein